MHGQAPATPMKATFLLKIFLRMLYLISKTTDAHPEEEKILSYHLRDCWRIPGDALRERLEMANYSRLSNSVLQWVVQVCAVTVALKQAHKIRIMVTWSLWQVVPRHLLHVLFGRPVLPTADLVAQQAPWSLVLLVGFPRARSSPLEPSPFFWWSAR